MTVDELRVLLGRVADAPSAVLPAGYVEAVRAELAERVLHEDVEGAIATAEARLVREWEALPVVAAHLDLLILLGALEQAQRRLTPIPTVAPALHAQAAAALPPPKPSIRPLTTNRRRNRCQAYRTRNTPRRLRPQRPT